MDKNKESFLLRLKRSKLRKQERLEELVKDMTVRYEQRTGLKVNYTEVW